jgi:hypothetical protein
VGNLDGARLAFGHAECGHRIQAQQGQVHEIVVAQGATVQVGVNHAEALEAALDAPFPGQGRNHQALGVTHDDVGHRALAVHQDPDLAAQLTRNFRQLPRQLRGKQLRRRYLAAVQALQGPVVMGF